MRLRTALAFLLLSACGTSKVAPITAPEATPLSAKIPTESVAPLVKPDNGDSDIDNILARNQILSSFPCPQWFDTATRAGWPVELWPQLSYIIWRESRCHIDSHNTTDPYSGSRGLMQINGFWCRPNTYTSQGFLQDQQVLTACADLFDPSINLQSGWAIYQYSVDRHNNGWGPWAMKQGFEPPIVDQ
jgi:hypothetical protein